MDLVNSVTQNSNNKNVTMENQPPIYQDSALLYSSASASPATETMQMQQAPSMELISRGESNAAKTPDDKNQLPDYLKAIGMDPKKFWPKKYRFTREKTPGQYQPLSIAQRNFYESNGYLILDGCNSQKLIGAIKAQHELRETSTDDALAAGKLLDKLVLKNTKLLQYVRCFCDERVMLMTNTLVETFQQSPSAGQQLVRDWIYLPFRPIDKVVCAITALDPLENVILVVPGTHKVGQCTFTSSPDDIGAATAYEASESAATVAKSNMSTRELFECSPKNLSSLVEKSQKGLKYLDLKPGQTFFYHPGLVHGFSDTLVNFQKRQLASIAYYAAADCEYIEMMRQNDDNQQVASADEVCELPIGLAHFGNQNPSDYNSWLNRPRLLQDLKASL